MKEEVEPTQRGQEEALDTLMRFKHLDDYKVLFAMLKHVEAENHITVSQVKIARVLSMSTPQVNRAIKRLIEVGILLRGQKEGISCMYQVSPEFAWKGSGKNHITALREHRTQKAQAAAPPSEAETAPEER
jgi:predicted transcriptional regulator